MRGILVVNPFGIGDVLFSMPLIQAIRTAYPHIKIGYLANERAYDVVRMSRAVDAVYMFDRDQFRRMGSHHPMLFMSKLWHFLSSIRHGRYDTMIDLSLARQYSFFAGLIGIHNRIGFNYKGRAIFLQKHVPLIAYEGAPVAEKQLELLKFFKNVPIPSRDSFSWNYAIPEVFQKKADELMQQMGIAENTPFIVMAPGGGRTWGRNMGYKQWDVEKFAELARRLSSEKGLKVVFAGDSYEIGLLNKTAELAGMTNTVMASEALPIVAAMLKRSQGLVCNDGGLMHMANMMGVKVIAIFGPVDENVYGPYRTNIPTAVITQPVPCRPCYQRFVFPTCRYDRQCLTQISVDRVYEAVKKVL